MNTNKQPKSKYLIDFKIINGLNLTIDQKKINRNCKLLDIDMLNTPSRISKRDNVVILTVGFGYNQFLQYEIKHNFNIDELNSISSKLIHNEIKQMIVESYRLTQIKTLKDLLTINLNL